MSSDAFTVHRKARLNRLQPSSDNNLEKIPSGKEASVPEETEDATTSKPVTEHTVETSVISSSMSRSSENNKKDYEPPEDIQENIASPASHQGVGKRSKQIEKHAAKTDQVRINIRITHPAPGVSSTFDQIAEVQGEEVAFRLVLGKALESYAAAVQRGGVIKSALTYSEGATVRKTSRMFPRNAYDEVAKVLNPTGLLSERAIGTMIGYHALAMFIADDKRHD